MVAVVPSSWMELSLATSTISRPSPLDQPAYEWLPLRITGTVPVRVAKSRQARISAAPLTYAIPAGRRPSKRVLYRRRSRAYELSCGRTSSPSRAEPSAVQSAAEAVAAPVGETEVEGEAGLPVPLGAPAVDGAFVSSEPLVPLAQPVNQAAASAPPPALRAVRRGSPAIRAPPPRWPGSPPAAAGCSPAPAMPPAAVLSTGSTAPSTHGPGRPRNTPQARCPGSPAHLRLPRRSSGGSGCGGFSGAVGLSSRRCAPARPAAPARGPGARGPSSRRRSAPA